MGLVSLTQLRLSQFATNELHKGVPARNILIAFPTLLSLSQRTATFSTFISSHYSLKNPIRSHYFACTGGQATFWNSTPFCASWQSDTLLRRFRIMSSSLLCLATPSLHHHHSQETSSFRTLQVLWTRWWLSWDLVVDTPYKEAILAARFHVS